MRTALFTASKWPPLHLLLDALLYGTSKKFRVELTVEKSGLRLTLQELQVVGVVMDRSNGHVSDWYIVTFIAHKEVTVGRERLISGQEFTAGLKLGATGQGILGKREVGTASLPLTAL